MITTSFKINYENFLKFTIIVIFFGIFSRTFAKVPAALIEYSVILVALTMAFIYISERLTKQQAISTIFYLFALYLIAHLFVACVFRPAETGVPFYFIIFSNMHEFALSTLGYFLPFLFIPLRHYDTRKFDDFMCLLIKISIIYTLFEQLLSLGGFRGVFEQVYKNAGLVQPQNISSKSLGLYRVWGSIGSPQLLGIFNIIAFFYLMSNNQKNWAMLSVLAIFLSTSKTAYFIFLILFLIYLIYKRHYLIFITITIISLISAYYAIVFLNHMEDLQSDDYQMAQHFIGSVRGYFILFDQTLDYKNIRHDDGPFIHVLQYFRDNPWQLIFGKGITYAAIDTEYAFDISSQSIFEYRYLSSDFYFLTFFEQYGFVGMILFINLYLIYPLILLRRNFDYSYFIPITFFLSILHYPPQISKIMMIFVGYIIWKMYLTERKET